MAMGTKELWKMAGPDDGDPTMANSKRAELAGYAASLELLLMLTSWVKMSFMDTLYTQTWIDSYGASRHLLISSKNRFGCNAIHRPRFNVAGPLVTAVHAKGSAYNQLCKRPPRSQGCIMNCPVTHN